MILNLIEQFGLKNAKPVGTPITEVVLPAEDMNLLSTQETSLFRTMAGALLWIARCTRPDIACAIHQITRRCVISRWESESYAIWLVQANIV
jgi:hypothetical protein